jgi:hypothetical protein
VRRRGAQPEGQQPGYLKEMRKGRFLFADSRDHRKKKKHRYMFLDNEIHF